MIKRLFRISTYLVALFVFFFILKSFAPKQDFALLIKDGFILDGNGNPWFKGDIGINGKKIVEIGNLSEKRAAKTIDNAADLIIDIEKNGGATGIFFQMDETDVEYLMELPYTMHASDGGVQVGGRGVPHPRNYGTFPRVFAHYVRDRGVITIEEAVRKMTSLPAQAFRIRERGMLREGMYADITVFDYRSFKDQATFAEPHQYGQGLRCVIVNGQVVVTNDTHTGNRPGTVIYGLGKKQDGENDSQD